MNREKVTVFTIYKFFTPLTRTFEALQQEVEAVNWLALNFPDYEIETKGSDTRSALEALQANDNTCILNLRKSTEREQIEHFSQPTINFLPQHLYVKKESVAANKLDAVGISPGDTLNFAKVFSVFPEALVANGGALKATFPLMRLNKWARLPM